MEDAHKPGHVERPEALIDIIPDIINDYWAGNDDVKEALVTQIRTRLMFAIDVDADSGVVCYLGNFNGDPQSVMLRGWKWIETRNDLAASTCDIIDEMEGLFILGSDSARDFLRKLRRIRRALKKPEKPPSKSPAK